MPDLRFYRARRDLSRTPEPFGDEAGPRALPADAPRIFAVQQHRARQLHWDLRLEVDGVLASWAVPKGPSLDPGEKRFAARTEDHPLEYAEFEGIIPPGNYGAGAMILWDHGSYRTLDGRSPAEGLAAGKLDLELRGHKLAGRFALVRMKGERGRSWLLLYKGRRVAEALDPTSVLSGLDVDELASGASPRAALEARLETLGAPLRELDAASLRPMLASAGDGPFSREGWLFELKYDGVRAIAQRRGSEVRLWSRRGHEIGSTYPEIARALAHWPIDAFALDGEIAALDASGRSSFELLQRRFASAQPDPRAPVENPVRYFAFDLVALLGRDLRALPLVERKRLLAQLVPRLGRVAFSDHVEGDGRALFEAAEQAGLEGVIAKRGTSTYASGRRSRDWLKLKVARRAQLVIAGWAPERGARRALGALVLAGYRGAALVYAGNVGSGLDEATRAQLERELALRRASAPAFAGGPARWPRNTAWCRPELVCQVRFGEVTSAGVLRHPVFERLCPESDPRACRLAEPRGEPAAAAAPAAERAPAAPQLSNLDKVFWPVEGYTKGDLLAYYEAVWPWLAPHLRDRPVVLTRYPDGIEGKSFYQKNAPDFTPEWALRESIDGTDYFVCNDLRTLLHVINSGAIPLHVWSARRGDLEHPDWLVLDLDPKEAPFAHVIEVARHIHALLDELGAAHFAKTSGQDGLHVLLPLGGALGHEQARLLAEVLARVVVAELPEIATIARPVAARADRVYVDYLQNGRGKLIAAPFSVRPRPLAPVSMPLRWTQLNARLDPRRWNIRTAPRELARRGDPLAGLLGARNDVAGLLDALGARLAAGADPR
jgi:bifunctional non-homologous end joining protein LigD